MATSLEKARALVDQLLDLPDDQLRAALPHGVPMAAARLLMPFVPNLLPATAVELDQQLDACEKFIAVLRSDPAAELAAGDEPV
jgi:hypothetical protein